MEAIKIGIDLGTANTLVYLSGRGVIFNEPTVVAFDRDTDKIIAIGFEAKEMLGKTHDKIRTVRPIIDGAIADKDAVVRMLSFIFENRLLQNNVIKNKSTTILLCCHSDLTSVEKKALQGIITNMGVTNVFVQEEVKAGAIGSGINIYQPDGTMVIDIGAGSSDVGILSLGDVVVSKSINIAGNTFDQEIKKYIKVKYNFEIGLLTAEQIKIELATLRDDLKEEKIITVLGRNLQTGLPSKINFRQSEVRNILKNQFIAIANTIQKVLEMTPPELSSDIIERGIIVNGGGALIDGLQEYLQSLLHLKVKLSEDPITSVVRGTKELLKNQGNYLVAPND